MLLTVADNLHYPLRDPPPWGAAKAVKPELLRSLVSYIYTGRKK